MFDDTGRVDTVLLEGVGGALREAFSQVREEFDDHLAAINENTNEIQSAHEYISEVDAKLEKLNSRLEKIEIFLSKVKGFEMEEKRRYDIKPLTKREKEIFLVLYTKANDRHMSYLDIARMTGLTEDLVSTYLSSIKRKGVPIVKKFINSKASISLDSAFKRAQARENILNIEQKTLVFA